MNEELIVRTMNGFDPYKSQSFDKFKFRRRRGGMEGVNMMRRLVRMIIGFSLMVVLLGV